MKDFEIKEYLDKKFEDFNKKNTSSKRWFVAIAITLVVALVSSGFTWSRAVGSLESRTEMIYKEYVPGDLLWVIMYSYDFQNEYFLSLLNGDKEGAEEKFKEFIQFRKDMYEQHFKTRGYIPTEGRVITKQ